MGEAEVLVSVIQWPVIVFRTTYCRKYQYFINLSLLDALSGCSMDEYTLEVPDMTCEGCEIVITGTVSVLPGVGRVDADAAAGRVTIHGGPSAKQRARAAIEEAGYDVRE
jgi:copper chaperone CopZ